jgi:hypothetical protein
MTYDDDTKGSLGLCGGRSIGLMSRKCFEVIQDSA